MTLQKLQSRITVLNMKRVLLQKIIEEFKTDPRVEEPIRQQREINKQLTAALKEWRALQGIPEPEAQTVNLKSIPLFSRARGGK